MADEGRSQQGAERDAVQQIIPDAVAVTEHVRATRFTARRRGDTTR